MTRAFGGGKLNIQEKTKKKKKNERGKHDQKASNDIADWKFRKKAGRQQNEVIAEYVSRTERAALRALPGFVLAYVVRLRWQGPNCETFSRCAVVCRLSLALCKSREKDSPSLTRGGAAAHLAPTLFEFSARRTQFSSHSGELAGSR